MLAILDHNHHIQRGYRESVAGEKQYHRVWRRRSRRWDVVPKKIEKNYSYIPELINNICSFRAQQDQPIRTIRGKKRSGSAITPDVPPNDS